MKILHFADLHIGVENYSRTDSETGLPTRMLDFLAAFDSLVDYAIKEKVDLAVFSGDAYKSRDPSQTQQREFAKRIKRLSDNNILVFLLVGNHDLPNTMGRATTADIFSTLDVKNVYVSQKPEITKIKTKSGYVQVASLPWLRRSALIAQLAKSDEAEISFEDINTRLQSVLTGIVESLAKKLEPDIPSILSAHVWVSEASLGSERSMTIGQEHILLLGNIANPKFDYVALGHLHKAQVLKENPLVIYSGSLERVDFGEEHDDKGFYIIDIETDSNGKRNTNYKFIKLGTRKFLTIRMELDKESADPTADIIAKVEKQKDKLEGAIVRLLITLPSELEGEIRDNEINKHFSETHYFAVSKEVKREVRVRFTGKDAKKISPKDALKEYVAMQNYSKEFSDKLISAGEELLSEHL